MRPTVRIRNGIRKWQNLVVVAVIILQDNIDKYFITLPWNDDRLRMKHLFVLAELLNEFLNPVFVEESFLFRRITTLIGEVDLEAGIQKCQLAQTRRQPFKFKFGRDREDRRIGQESDERAGGLLVFYFADDRELVGRFTLGEGHVIDLAVARDF